MHHRDRVAPGCTGHRLGPLDAGTLARTVMEVPDPIEPAGDSDNYPTEPESAPWPPPDPADARITDPLRAAEEAEARLGGHVRDRGDKRLLRAVVAVIVSGLAATLLGGWLLGPSGSARSLPGPGIDVSAAVVGPVADTAHPRPSRFTALTVQLEQLSRLEAWWAEARGEDLIPLGPASDHAGLMMEYSQSTAAALAWEVLTGEQPTLEVAVAGVVPGSPAETAGLLAGDVLLSGTADAGRMMFSSADEVSAFVRAAGAGAEVRFEIHRNGTEQGVTVTVGPDSMVGITVANRAVGVPNVVIEGVGGSSAGLLMTLALIDAQSPGDLTAGMAIVGTGTIEPDGSVGAIGGLAEKLRAREARAADLVFIPTSQPETVRDSRIVRVGTLAEALAVLCERGATDEVCASR